MVEMGGSVLLSRPLAVPSPKISFGLPDPNQDRSVFEFIEAWCNGELQHSAISYLSSKKYEG